MIGSTILSSRNFLKHALLLLFAVIVSASAFSEEHGSASEAVDMVKKAVAFTKEKGKDQLLTEASNPKGRFVSGDLYLSVYNLDGVVLAHGVNPKLIGKNIVTLNDVDGKFFIKDILQQAREKGKGTEDYKWPHPVTKEYQAKSAYFEVVDGVIISCGYYKY